MGFYGNITNTSNTTFQFDKVYPNRLSMDANVNNDGIFIGRYVLVEYDQNAAYPVVFIKNGKFYSSPGYEDITRIKYGQNSDQIYLNDIVQNQEEDTIKYYKCIGNSSDGYALFTNIIELENRTNYITNYQIDENHYYNVSDFTEISFKGYDSTVWVKTTINTDDGLITKYVNIADMNSVVPTFAVVADAPTMNPITPHFDADSTNVYYKLHMQSPYGFRVAASEGKSDEQITWTTTTYDKETNTTTTSTTEPFAGDIYYNKAGFNPEVVSKVTGENYIKLEPTAKSGAIYSHGQETNDIQEFRLHLPAIGNMMSDAWDIIHGPNRDNARTDENSSLQGRLDSFKFMADNQIPVKRTADGTLVGTNINGNSNRVIDDIKSETLHISDKTKDDAWIRTEINTNALLDENGNEAGNNGISIHHTFTATADTTSTSNKNTDSVQSSNNFDKIELYTPIVDAAGHVVGKNTETVTLPYGYKSIEVNNSNAVTAAPVSTDGKAQTADNTQDTIQFNASNKWIKLEAETEDTIKFGHLLKTVTPTTSEATLSNDKSESVTFEVYNDTFDEAGHHNGRDTKTITMPFGYGKITGDTGSTSASATFDTLAINADDAWIATEASTDKINITHTGPVISTVTATSNIDTPQFGSKFTIEDWHFDEKGHKHTRTTHTVQFPKGDLNDFTATGSSVLTGISMVNETGIITQTNADVGTLTLKQYEQGESGNLVISDTNTINGAFKGIQDYINKLDMSDTSTTQFISKITQVDGKISVERANVGTLVLGTASTDKTISADDSLNAAINKLEARIKTEEENRKNAIDTLYGNNGEKIAEAFDTIKEIADWLDNDSTTGETGVEKLISDISNNAQAITDEANRAKEVEQNLDAKINNLDYEKAKVDNYYISSIKQVDGLIEVGTTQLPIRSIASGTVNGAILVNGNNVNVYGLGTAAFTDSSAYVAINEFENSKQQFDKYKAETVQTINNINSRCDNLKKEFEEALAPITGVIDAMHRTLADLDRRIKELEQENKEQKEQIEYLQEQLNPIEE